MAKKKGGKSKTVLSSDNEGNDKPEKREKKSKKGGKSNKEVLTGDENEEGQNPETLEKKPKGKKDKGDKRSKKGLKNLTPEEVAEDRKRSSLIKIEPETEVELWNSEEVIAHKLQTDGFTYSMVLAMEDSSGLTSTGHYLDQAIKSGIQKTGKAFMGINGEEIATKVKKFLSIKPSGNEEEEEEEANTDNFCERIDLWAEAIKHILIKKKQTSGSQMGAGDVKKELELTGATVDENKIEEITEPNPTPPPSSSSSKKDKKDKKSKKEGKKKKNELTTDESTTMAESTTNDNSTATDVPVPAKLDPDSGKLRSRIMRKRGEGLEVLPKLEEIRDDSAGATDESTKGPHLYVVLHGFYNPKLLLELLKIGVPVDGILLLTDQEVTKGNCAAPVADTEETEDSIPDTVRPENILPNYLKFLETQTTLPRQELDVVGQFWAELAELYNTVPSDSPLLVTDATLLCKAIDSWDSRFAVDMYLEAFEEFEDMIACEEEEEEEEGEEEEEWDEEEEDLLIDCGIVTPMKMIAVNGRCHCGERMNKARNCRESMVLVNPLQSRDPRKGPVRELSSQFRWFAYILERANTKKPKFIPSPRADFIRRKEAGEFTVKANQGPPSAELVTHDLSAGGGEEPEEDAEEEEMELLASSQSIEKAQKKGHGKAEKPEKPQKEDKGKLKTKKSKKGKLNATESNPSEINQNASNTKKLAKQKSGKKNKKETRKASLTSRTNNLPDEEEYEGEGAEETIGLEEEQAPVEENKVTDPRTEKRTKQKKPL